MGVGPVSLGCVVEFGDVWLYRGGKIAGHGFPGAFVFWAGLPVVAACRSILVWNLSHVPKLNPFPPRVEGACFGCQGQGGTSGKPEGRQRWSNSLRFKTDS